MMMSPYSMIRPTTPLTTSKSLKPEGTTNSERDVAIPVRISKLSLRKVYAFVARSIRSPVRLMSQMTKKTIAVQRKSGIPKKMLLSVPVKNSIQITAIATSKTKMPLAAAAGVTHGLPSQTIDPEEVFDKREETLHGFYVEKII
jgi:hypothetical protein